MTYSTMKKLDGLEILTRRRLTSVVCLFKISSSPLSSSSDSNSSKSDTFDSESQSLMLDLDSSPLPEMRALTVASARRHAHLLAVRPDYAMNCAGKTKLSSSET